MAVVLLFGALAILSLLYSTNQFLRGAQKETIGGLLGLAIVATLLTAFIVLGWRLGLVAVLAVPVLVPVVQPLARALGRSLLGYRTGPEGGHHPTYLNAWNEAREWSRSSLDCASSVTSIVCASSE
jgi:hypothetical protein